MKKTTHVSKHTTRWAAWASNGVCMRWLCDIFQKSKSCAASFISFKLQFHRQMEEQYKWEASGKRAIMSEEEEKEQTAQCEIQTHSSGTGGEQECSDNLKPAATASSRGSQHSMSTSCSTLLWFLQFTRYVAVTMAAIAFVFLKQFQLAIVTQRLNRHTNSAARGGRRRCT